MDSKLLAYIKDGTVRISFKENKLETMELIQSLIKFLNDEEIPDVYNTTVIFDYKKKKLKTENKPSKYIQKRIKLKDRHKPWEDTDLPWEL